MFEGLLHGDGPVQHDLDGQVVPAVAHPAHIEDGVAFGQAGIDLYRVVPDDAAARRPGPAAEAAHTGGDAHPGEVEADQVLPVSQVQADVRPGLEIGGALPQHPFQHFAVGAPDQCDSGYVETAEPVDELPAVWTQPDIVPSRLFGEPQYLPGPDVSPEKMVLGRGDLGGSIVDISSVIVEVGDIPVPCAKPAYRALCVAQVEVAVSVPVGGDIYEPVIAALDKIQRVKRFYIFVIVLREDCPDIFSVAGVVHVESHVFLTPVQHLDENVPAVRGPCDSCEVSVRTEICYINMQGVA